MVIRTLYNGMFPKCISPRDTGEKRNILNLNRDFKGGDLNLLTGQIYNARKFLKPFNSSLNPLENKDYE